MKKILLATTMLAGFAGAAAAEVTVTGEARMGIIDDGGVNGAQFTSRVRVKFVMEGETDGGLAFGAEVRNDQSSGNGGTIDIVDTNDIDGDGNVTEVITTINNGTTGTTNGDSVVYISGAFGKLSMGDVGTAADNIVGNVSGVGLTGLGDYNELGYLGNDKTAAKYEYTSGAFTGALSVGQQYDGVDATVSIAVKYAAETFSVALGYEDADGDDQLTLGADATFGAVTAKVRVADQDSAADTRAAVSIDYVAGATTFTAFYADHGTDDGFGIGAAYDLGGGASVKGGIVDTDLGDTAFDLGVAMTF
ncbi:porin [Neogemmobacter tilapiae]|uniref:Porin n=1 Tax=Neogemmobacter tilapiae TaxID=875041 RepID=A0A918TPQ5_9RHOB|nr:porin [Gemmobacter tilapiae]GHC55548.1 porin [Gemmobacter tilapiae]